MSQVAIITGIGSRQTGFRLVPLCWLLLSAFLGVMRAFGYIANGDVDDIMKVHEIRSLLENGIFQRVLPNILQPEPFATHWPLLVDLPYIVIARLLAPLVGTEAALSMSLFSVPLLLLAPTLYFMWEIVRRLDFDRPTAAFLLCLYSALRALLEFEPGRVDYHNLQMMLLMASVALTLRRTTNSALVNGVVVGVAISIGLELATFFAATMAIYAIEFAMRRDAAERMLMSFGTGLAVSALLLFFTTTEFSTGGPVMCDRYSSPYALALVLAGLSFAAAPLILSPRHGFVWRASFVALCAAVAGAVVAASFPQCLAGPYAALSPYLKQSWLANIFQEHSIFELTRLFHLTSTVPFLVLFVSVGAIPAIAFADRFRDRDLNVFSLFTVVSIVHAVLYFRYFRFMPLFAGPGMAALLACALPQLGRMFQGKLSRAAPFWPLMAAPGAVFVLATAAYHMTDQGPAIRATGADLAANCLLEDMEVYRWPAGARVLAPPVVSMFLLEQRGVTLTSVPYHTGAPGIERAHRFFDPVTPDEQREPLLRQAQATHVAVCGADVDVPRLDQRSPFAFGLMRGRAPAWLRQCDLGSGNILNIYRVGAAECPVVLTGPKKPAS